MATIVSIASYAYWSGRGLVLAYGDAISHMEIARHVFTSTTPGLAQLGSEWLPLDHLLMLPFIWIDPLYRSGLAGAIPAMAAYVVGCVAIAALARMLFSSIWAGALAAVVFGANANLLYLQSTPLGESLMVTSSVLTALFLARWIRVAARDGRRFRWSWRARIGAEDLDAVSAASNGEREGAGRSVLRITRRPFSPTMASGTVLNGMPEVGPLVLLAASACAATLLRYDGWAIAMATALAVGLAALMLWGPRQAQARLIVFGFLGFAGCAGWILYNWIIFGDPLDFFRGNYSSSHQQQHIAGQYGLPTKGNLLLSGHIYLQTVIDTVGWPVVIGGAIGLLSAFIFLIAIPARRSLRASQQAASVAPSQSGAEPSAPSTAWALRNGLAWAAVVSVLLAPFMFNWAALYAGTSVILTPEIPSGSYWYAQGQLHAYFNDRYGIMMLPLIALGVAALAPLTVEARRRFDEAAAWGERALSQLGGAAHRALVGGVIATFLLTGLVSTIGGTPYVLADPLVGVNAPSAHGSQVEADWLRARYTGGRILASNGAFAGLTFYTGLPDQDFLNESTKPMFGEALITPENYATWIVFNSDSSNYDPVYDYLVTRGSTAWQAYYTLVYHAGSTFIYERNT